MRLSWGGSPGGVAHARLALSPQDCLRACQEQIETLLETSLRGAPRQAVTTETKSAHRGQCLSATPTDVQDVTLLMNTHKS